MKQYEPLGLRMIAVTRLYGGSKEKPLTAEDERLQVEKVWKESYPNLAGVPVVIDTDAMVRYGASATPTFALVDRTGKVHSYSPTRVTADWLSVRIDEMLKR